MYNILVVDDESRIRTIIRKYAEFEGHKVTEAGDGMEAVLRCREGGYDIVIMDIMMPELDGFSACREIRKSSDVPIIMLSARGEEYDKINGFGLGIDDYVVKPFSPKELMMRVEAVMKRTRRSSAPASGGKPHEIVELDGGGLKADITALSHEQLLREVWGYDFYGDARTLDTHIKLLRKSLGRYADCVVTLRGVGYRFESALAEKPNKNSAGSGDAAD